VFPEIVKLPASLLEIQFLFPLSSSKRNSLAKQVRHSKEDFPEQL
jgi:hypothetical protein